MTEDRLSALSRRRFVQALAAGVAVGTGLGSTGTVAATGGEELWRFESDDIPSTGPTVVDGTAYVTADRSLFAIDAETGEKEWEFDESSSGRSPTVVDGKTYIGTLHDGVQVNDTESGDLEANFHHDPEGEYWDRSVTVAHGQAYAVEQTHSEEILRGFDVESGEIQWEVETEGTFGTPVTVEDTVYIEDQQAAEVIALVSDVGSDRWRTSVAEDGGFGGGRDLDVVDGNVYVASDEDETVLHVLDRNTGEEKQQIEQDPYLFDRTIVGGMFISRNRVQDKIGALSTEDGAILWEYDVDNLGGSLPTVADGVVYFGDRDGQLHAVTATDGEHLWTVEIADRTVNTSPIVVDGVVYVCCDMEVDYERGDVVALEAEGDGSSVDSRILQGTHNHHDAWTGDASPITDPHWVTDEEDEDDGDEGEVDEADDDTDNDTDDDTEEGADEGTTDDDDDGMPGFGIGGALVGVGGAAYLLNERLGTTESDLN